MGRLAAVLLALALAACGCAMVGPDYRRPATDLPPAYAEAGASASSSMPVPAQWGRLYGDATLDELVRSGLARNADVRLAAARVEEAEAALREARATLLFPLVEGQAGAARGRSVQFGTGNNFTLGLSTSFEVDVWGRLRRGGRAVRDQLFASRYGEDTVALTLAATIARTYFTALSRDWQDAASQQSRKAANGSLDLAQKLLAGGAGSALDVYQAGSLAAATAAQSKEIARQRAAIVHQMGVLTGRLDIKVPTTYLGSLPVPPLPPAGLPSELLERRPDVRQAEAHLASPKEHNGRGRPHHSSKTSPAAHRRPTSAMHGASRSR